jgi:hypothetical protein
MPSTHVWTGQEVHHLNRFRDMLRAASGLVGHDDFLANLLLEDALDALHGALGEPIRPFTGDDGKALALNAHQARPYSTTAWGRVDVQIGHSAFGGPIA